jgi:hypothetical protein
MSTPNIQVMNAGSSILIQKGTKNLLVSKEQIKTIDTVHANIVRIDIGEGPLKNILINYQDVYHPAVDSASGLRDFINGLLVSDNYSGNDATEETLQNILTQFGAMTTILETLTQPESDFAKSDPTRSDESNANIIYKGWHGGEGNTIAPEWAILRIRNVDDTMIYEWALGNKAKVNIWDERESLIYLPFNFNGPY